MKLEHIDNLTKGKKSGAKIGSRKIGHHLFDHERKLYEIALKKGFLEITSKHRANLRNVWNKVCEVKEWDEFVFVKNMEKNESHIEKNNTTVFRGTVAEGKKQIKELVQKP